VGHPKQASGKRVLAFEHNPIRSSGEAGRKATQGFIVAGNGLANCSPAPSPR